MFFYVKLAVRNLLRNKRRALIAGTAIAIGLASLIFVDALIIGMEDNMEASATESFLGDGQIHSATYRDSREVEDVVADLQDLTSELESDSLVQAFTKRAYSFAMITAPSNVAAVSMVGIDPTTEKDISQVDEAIIAGEYLDPTRKRQVLIGSKLAEILEAKLGDRIVLTVAQARGGDLSQEMFRVAGIYRFNIEEMDRAMAFVLLPRAQQMLALGNDVHEIALDLTSSSIGRNEHDRFWQRYSQQGNEARGWLALMPELKLTFEVSQFSTLALGIILFAVVALGIINTLFMSMHERMFEFGVLRAVGTRPLVMARLVLFEAAALALLSIVLGTILGYALTYIISVVGIDYRGIEYSGITFRELLYPVLAPKQFIIYPLAVFIFTALAGLYPAFTAARLQPAEAMRRSF